MSERTLCDDCGVLLVLDDTFISSHVVVRPVGISAGTYPIRSKWHYCVECWESMGGKFGEFSEGEKK